MKKTKHWLFDFDGTLVDSMPYWSACMVGVLDDHNVPYPENIINIITPLGTEGTAKYFQKIGLDLPFEKIDEEIFARLVEIYHKVVPAKEYVIDCLKKMRKAGYKLHVLTASRHFFLDPCLVRLGMYDLFDNVWSSDDFGMGKTNPEIYCSVAKKLGVSVCDITFLDDNINANETAKNAGTQVIGVYDKTSSADENKMRGLLDGYIYNFSELEKIIF